MGGTQPTHTQHRAWHVVGTRSCLLKEDSGKVTTGPGVMASGEEGGQAQLSHTCPVPRDVPTDQQLRVQQSWENRWQSMF